MYRNTSAGGAESRTTLAGTRSQCSLCARICEVETGTCQVSLGGTCTQHAEERKNAKPNTDMTVTGKSVPLLSCLWISSPALPIRSPGHARITTGSRPCRWGRWYPVTCHFDFPDPLLLCRSPRSVRSLPCALCFRREEMSKRATDLTVTPFIQVRS